ncbi:o-succinylbenzoate synthase [Anaerolentibacter hominis]|uniref:o-succinylbenzoate synthase n=1 Tax=Anaerolentibacter hominis TaxID=3079009 RepID=UPI0031B88709
MRIDALDVYYVENPLKNPWTTAYGSDPSIYSVLVKMSSGSYSAWAEACPLYAPTYSPEYARGVYEVITRFLSPLVLGKEFETPEDINRALAVVKGNPFAKSGLEMAWWTLRSKMTQKPLHELLGGSYHEVETGADFGIQDSIDTLLGLIDQAFQDGYKRVKLKVKPGWDYEMLRAVRTAFPNGVFHIDCNSGYTPEDLPLFQKIDKLGLAMIEQPLFHADLVQHARLQARLETPLCLDESINSYEAAEAAAELNACGYINIKPGRVGGLYPSLRINRLCQEAGIGNWIGGMLETSIGVGICAELATIGNMTYPSDIFPSDYLYPEEISENKVVLSSPGKIMPSLVPGNGYVPEKEKLWKRTLEKVHLEP